MVGSDMLSIGVSNARGNLLLMNTRLWYPAPEKLSDIRDFEEPEGNRRVHGHKVAQASPLRSPI